MPSMIIRIGVTLSLPPKELSPNARVHYMAKARAAKAYRSLAWAAACEQIGRHDAPQWEVATEQAIFYFKSNRRRDRDNLLASLKPAFDGLADAGVIADDSGFTHLPVIIKKDTSRPRVEIAIWEGNENGAPRSCFQDASPTECSRSADECSR